MCPDSRQNQNVAAELTGLMQNRPVHRHQNILLPQGQPQQISIRNLLMPENPPQKWPAQRPPIHFLSADSDVPDAP